MVSFIGNISLIGFYFLFPFCSLGYRPFMMILQQQVNMLDKFVIQQESVSHLMLATSNLKPSQQFTKIVENLEQVQKNVSDALLWFYVILI